MSGNRLHLVAILFCTTRATRKYNLPALRLAPAYSGIIYYLYPLHMRSGYERVIYRLTTSLLQQV
jgi:hypothetical protein